MDTAAWIRQAGEKYVTAVDLIENTSRSDPVNQPYRSKYEGRSILLSLVSGLDTEVAATDDEETKNTFKLIEALLNYELGVVAFDVEESSVGDKHLHSARSLLTEHFGQNLHLILFHLKICNAVSLIRSSFADYENALSVLRRAESLYKEWHEMRTEDPTFQTIPLKDAFVIGITAANNSSVSSSNNKKQSSDATTDEVEKSYTQTIYYLAQVLEKVGENESAARYCTQTLVRQFESNDYDAMDWSVNAATLSQYYACHNKFLTARRLLAVAQFQLDKIPEDGSELLQKRRADLDRIFVKYCMMLMDRHAGEEVPADDTCNILSISDPQLAHVEEGIPAARAGTGEAALRIFLFANKRLSSALNFLTLNEHASDHADCVLDQSRLFQLLIAFQSEPGKICKMHKRRIDLLEKLLSELNPTYFLAHVRRILFEQAEACSEMVHYKIIDAESSVNSGSNDKQTVRSSVIKVNSLISKAIQNFARFTDTFRDKRTGQLPARFEGDDVRAILVAWFSSGRLHSKKISCHPNDQLQFWTDSESCYQQVIDYIDKNPDQEDLIQNEIAVIREMLPLIPEKKKLILSSTVY